MSAGTPTQDRPQGGWKSPGLIVLGVLMLVSAAVILHYRSRLGFMLDEWQFVIYREHDGLADFLDPHNEHIVVLPVIFYKVFLHIFGMSSAMPLQVFTTLVFLASVLALYFWMRPLIGEPITVIGCALVLFLGAGWEDLLWSFQIGFSISIAAGIAALLMLRREDGRGDRLACAFLVISILGNSLGLALIVGGLVSLLTRTPRSWKSAYVVLVPFAVYAIWWIGWGHTAETALSLSNAVHAPKYIFDAFTEAVADLTGTFRISGSGGTWLTRIISLAVIAGTGFHLYRKRILPRPFLIAVAMALVFWGLAALNEIPGRDFTASRYQFPSAVFLLMILAGAFEGTKVQVRSLLAIGTVAAIAIVVNLAALRHGERIDFEPIYQNNIASLTALDISRETVDPRYAVGVSYDDLSKVDARSYFEAEDRYGSPGWTEAEILEKPQMARSRVDQMLIGALPVTSRPSSLKPNRKRCVTLDATDPSQTLTLNTTRLLIHPQNDVYLTLGRFGDGAPNGVKLYPAGSTTITTIPRDTSDRKWRAGFVGTGLAEICPVS